MLTGLVLGLAVRTGRSGCASGSCSGPARSTGARTARAAAEARTAAVEDVRKQMAGEFAQLSSEALRRNADQFLQLADARLGESRQAAEGDLAQRQEAIEHLLAPIAEQLGKYDEGMQQLERANASGRTRH